MRRLHAIQKCHSTAVLLRHFFGCGRNTRGLKNAVFERLFLLFFLLNCGTLLHAQNGVDISSSEEPGPTSTNPIPIDIKFEGPVNRDLVEADLEVTNGGIQNITRVDPKFPYQGSGVNLENFQVKTTEAELIGAFFSNNIESYLAEKLKETVVSVDFNENNELFYLTLYDGVFKINQSGIGVNVIPGNKFSTPLDLAINRDNGNIYIADSEKGQVLVFDSSYSALTPIGTGSNANSDNPRGATGLALDQDGNIYVADNFTGNTPDQDAIKIYSPNGILLKKIPTYNGQQIQDPYRIAVDKHKNIYVSESGGSQRNPRIIIFDKDYKPVEVIQGGVQGNPGSLVVDEYGYLYVIDYRNDFNLTDLFNDPLEVLSNYETIRDSRYTVNVFNTNEEFKFVKQFDSSNLNLPIDLALDNCGEIALNNLRLQGAPPQDFFSYPALMDINFDFTLKYFQRQDNFIAEVVPVAPGEVKVVIEESDLFKCDPQPEDEFSIEYEEEDEVILTPPVFFDCEDLTVSTDLGQPGAVVYFNPTASDKNGAVEVNLISTFGSGDEFPIGTTTVRYEAVNTAGTSTCEFTVTVMDDEDPVITCPGDIPVLVDPGECEVRVTFPDPKVTDNSGNWSLSHDGPDSGSFFPVGKTEIEFKATDPSGNFATCILTIIVDDEEAPVFNACPPDSLKIEAVDDRFFVPNLLSQVNAVDNCDDAIITYSQVPEAGEEIFSNTTLRIYAYDNDASGEDNQSTPCQVELIIENLDPLEITCSGDQTEDLQGSCDFSIPDYTHLASFNPGATITQSPAEGTVVDDNITIRLTASLDGATEFCEFEVNLINQAELIISCPGDQTEDADSAGRFSLPDYRGLANVTGDCEQFSLTQNPGEGIVIEEDTTITLTVIDVDGKEDSCEFEVQLVLPGDPDPLEITCPGDQTEDIQGSCDFSIPDYTPLASANPGATITQSPAEGTVVNGNTTIRLTVSLDGATEFCEFEVNLINQAELIISCPGDQTEDADSAGRFSLPDYRGLANVTGDCEQFSVTQNPGEGIVIEEDTTITLTVTDVDGKEDSCEFEVQLVLPGDPDPLEITCPGNLTPSFEENCSFKLPDYKNLATANSSTAQITQDPPEGTLIYGSTEITLTATEGNQIADCSFTVDPVDDVKPIINCRDDLEIHLNEDGFGVIPPEILLSTIEDNCGIDNISLSKSRFETSDVGENDILVTVEDVNGNIETCEATVNVVPYDPLKDIRCTESGELELDQDGYAELTLTYTGEEEDIQLELSKKDFTCDDIGLPQMITATYNGQYTGSCEVEVTVVDKLAPRVNCISKIDLVLDENGEGQLSVEDVDLNSTDNCRIEDMSLSKNNFTTEDVGTQTVRFTVTDASGNSDFCEVVVNVRPFMGTGGDLNCVEEIVLQLNNDGNAILKAEDLFDGDPSGIDFYGETTYTCEDLGTNYITFSKIDDPSQTCKIRVEVEDNIDPVAHCKADYVLTLGANGTATLSPEDFGAGSTDNCGIASMSLNRTSFTTADLGQQQLVLTVTDNSGNVDICETPILVQPYEENPSGIECKALFVLALNANGSAQLQPQDLFTGGMSGTYNVSQSIFTCEDLGENEVILSYSTVNGSGTCTVKVMVEDPQIVCDSSPAPERDSLIMYPNPGDGLISFELSPGLQINRIEIFDFRGRFLREQQYDNSQPIPEYQLDLSAYQAGVYPLVIYTNGREYLKRAIIK
ncbi:HYR domain-containing protein [Salinimicrobium sp. WS361]|uniref:HYR domain-containing protein n=1 Tax=Salinimicrobium sp. WS361 TaxID=3425123 RepID=UPI003D6F0423